MDANTMRRRFLLQYEGARLGNRTFNDREIADFLNKAQIQLVKTRYDALKNRTQRGFADTAIRQAELDGLLSSTVIISNDNMIQGTKYNGALRNPDRSKVYTTVNQMPDLYGVFVELPDECLYVVNQVATTGNNVDISTATIVKDNVPMEEINYLEYQSRIYDPYAYPYDNLVWSMSYGNWMPFKVTTPAGTGTEASPEVQAFVNSTKDLTLGVTGATFNFKGPTPKTFVDGVGGVGEEWIAFTSRRSKYLIPGADWRILEYQAHYIKTPPDIFIDVVTPSRQVNCTLADFLHQEIIDLSVKLASASILPEQNKYQVNDAETKINE